MKLFKEKIKQAKKAEKYFQINSNIEKGRSKDIDRLKIIDNNIYVYLANNSIQVYNINTFKKISSITLPFNRGKDSINEHIRLDILENGLVLILGNKKLYFYQIDLKASELKFLKYLSEVHHFCYLPKKKEIFLLTENTLIGDYYGMAKADLSGNIIFRNKENQPQIFDKYVPPQEVSGEVLFNEMSSRTPEYFSEYEGFNNDKYIMNVWGYSDNWFHYIYHAPKDENYNISIYDSDNLKELYDQKYHEDLRCVKITDKYFKKCYDNLSFFYYDDKNNKIIFINDITNRVYEVFNIVQKKSDEEENDQYEETRIQYFNLKNDIFCMFDGCFLFIMDLFSGKLIKKVDMNMKNKLNIKSLCLMEKYGQDYLYISVENYDDTKIINGVVI